MNDGILLRGSRPTALTYAARASSAGAKLSFAFTLWPQTEGSAERKFIFYTPVDPSSPPLGGGGGGAEELPFGSSEFIMMAIIAIS